MCPLPGNVPDWLGLHWGGNTQLYWRQPCQLLQDENGTEHLTLTLCCCVRCFSHACDPCNKCSISSSIYSSWVDTFDFMWFSVIFCRYLTLSERYDNFSKQLTRLIINQRWSYCSFSLFCSFLFLVWICQVLLYEACSKSSRNWLLPDHFLRTMLLCL